MAIVECASNYGEEHVYSEKAHGADFSIQVCDSRGRFPGYLSLDESLTVPTRLSRADYAVVDLAEFLLLSWTCFRWSPMQLKKVPTPPQCGNSRQCQDCRNHHSRHIDTSRLSKCTASYGMAGASQSEPVATCARPYNESAVVLIKHSAASAAVRSPGSPAGVKRWSDRRACSRSRSACWSARAPGGA